MDIRSVVRKTLNETGIKQDVRIPGPDDPIDWIESQFFVPELDGPIQLMPYHKAVLREAYRTDDNGRFVYSTILWSDIKKSIKSSIAAAVVLERARRTKYGSIKIVANDLKQAQSRVSFYLQRAVQMNPQLRELIRSQSTFTRFPNRCVIEAIPIDPTGEAGGNDDLIVFSELWGAKDEAAKRMWTELTLSPTKFGISQRWVETYAGYSGESETLEKLYTQGVKQGRLLDLGIPGLEVYANDAARLLCLWNTKPRCAWQTPDYYAQETSVLTASEFSRVHGNAWVSSEDKFVPDEWWNACKVATLPEWDKYKEIAVGIDAGVSNDCFGIVGVSRKGDSVIVRFSRKWTPPQGGKLMFTNPENHDDPEYPEGELRRLAKLYNVVAFGYDPSQLHHLCSTLKQENVGYFLEFIQGMPRLEADKQLYDVIRDRKIIHAGDPDLDEHIRNANQRNDPESHKLRIVKRADHLKIDLAVSLSMAVNIGYKLLPE